MTANAGRVPVGFETTPAVANAYGVSEIGIPETFFLDARHRIVKRILGGVTMKELNAGVALMDGHHAALAGSAGDGGPESRLTTVQSPPRMDRRTSRSGPPAWATRRTPRWVLPRSRCCWPRHGAVALVQRPSTAERASDLRGFLSDMTTDIESCAAGSASR